MGTVMTCINDMHFANPGFAAGQSSPDAGVRLILTDLERGPSVTSVQAHYVHPLRPNHSGLQATWLALDSGDGSVVLPGLGPTPVSMYENALVVDYGVRVSKRLTVGLSVLGYQETGFRLGALAGPNLLDVRARADYGARAGAAFEYAPGDYVGALYSFSQTSVDASGLLMPGPIRTDFNGDQLAIGASRHFGAKLLGVVEYHHGSTSNGALSSSTSTWHFGAEYLVPNGWAIRAGVADESPTFGFGHDGGRWCADYAYIRDWNEGEVGALFGGSDTHSLQVSGRW